MEGVKALVLASAFFLPCHSQPLRAHGLGKTAQILKTNCQPCHNEATRSSGLALTSRDSILAGGNRGAAIKPGSPSESLLVRAIEQTGRSEDAAGPETAAEQIAALRNWIEPGAAWPKEGGCRQTQRRGSLGLSAGQAG